MSRRRPADRGDRGPAGGSAGGPVLVGAALVVSGATAVGFMVLYVSGGQTQVEGALAATSLCSLGAALIWWAHRLLTIGVAVDEREPLGSGPDDRHAAARAFDEDEVLERRPVLRRLVLAVVAAIGAAAVFPLRSLGPRPVRTDPWRAGTRLVDGAGNPIHLDQVPSGGLVTVFPEGNLTSADGPTLLLRVDPSLIRAAPGREGWAPEGLLAYSKICTHAGCPVGLYEARSRTLLCPCHQSTFDVLDRARPTGGPAAAPLPQLPLRVTGDGGIVAAGPFSGPVGPASWDDR